MKNRCNITYILVLFLLLLVSCQNNSTSSISNDVKSPEIELRLPSSDIEVDAGIIIFINAIVYNYEDIESVDFYVDDIKIHSCNNEPYEYYWNTENMEGEFTLYARTVEKSNEISIYDSVKIEISNNPIDYHFSNFNPGNNDINVSAYTELSWEYNGKEEFDIYFGDSDSLTLVSENQVESSYYPLNLENSSSYYWKVVANDGTNQIHSDIKNFTTEENFAPVYLWEDHYVWYRIYDCFISWSCTDPNGDDLMYEVYFGTINEPPLVESNFSSTTYLLGDLEYSTTYYWKIVASDGKEHIESEIWSFTTIDPEE